MIEQVRRNNPDKEIFTTSDNRFREFGVLYDDQPVHELIRRSLTLFHETETTRYVASEVLLEANEQAFMIQQRIFGEIPIQIGCCYGVNSNLNGMEFHKSSELIIAATDLILMVGRIQDIDRRGMWNSAKTEFLYLESGEVVELFATTLHLAPSRVSADPFNALIVLPKGTNAYLSGASAGTLWRRNKWMLSHSEGPAARQGAAVLIEGKNCSISYQ